MNQQQRGGLAQAAAVIAQVVLSAIAEKNPIRQRETPGPLVLSATRSVVMVLAWVWMDAALKQGITWPIAVLGAALALALPLSRAVDQPAGDVVPPSATTQQEGPAPAGGEEAA